MPISVPLRQVLDRRQRVRGPEDRRVFRRDGVPVRVWRTALRDACRQAQVPHRLLHDCRRTAARNLIRAGVPERIAMLLTGHKTRAVFDRHNIVNEQELLTSSISHDRLLHSPPWLAWPSRRAWKCRYRNCFPAPGRAGNQSEA